MGTKVEVLEKFSGYQLSQREVLWARLMREHGAVQTGVDTWLMPKTFDMKAFEVDYMNAKQGIHTHA